MAPWLWPAAPPCAFDTSSAQVLAGVVSGSGTLIQQGAGLLTLANNNTFSGQTTIAATRQLSIGNSSGSTGSIAGDVNVGGIAVDLQDQFRCPAVDQHAQRHGRSAIHWHGHLRARRLQVDLGEPQFQRHGDFQAANTSHRDQRRCLWHRHRQGGKHRAVVSGGRRITSLRRSWPCQHRVSRWQWLARKRWATGRTPHRQLSPL